MSTKSIEAILSRAMNDVEFAVELLCGLQHGLAGYELTPQEEEQFKRLAQADFEAFPGLSPEERRSFGRSNHNESALKVRKALTANHNETALKMRKGIPYNHNQSALRMK